MVRGIIYEARRGLLQRKQWRAHTIDTSNGNKLMMTAEGYNNVAECEAAVRKSCPGIQLWVRRGPGQIDKLPG